MVLVHTSFSFDVGNTCIRILVGKENAAYYRWGYSANTWPYFLIPAYDDLVKISGKVKRPMRFEMKKDENLATLIKYAGGFEADAYTRSLRVVRQNGEEYEVNTVKDMDYSIYTMRNGDVVTAEAILNRFTNKLEIRGAVYRPGIYQLSGKLNTIRELVHEAQGLTGDAFLNRAVLYRQREDLTSEVVQIDIKSIMNGC